MAAITKKKKIGRGRDGRGGRDNTSQTHENANPQKEKRSCFSCGKYEHYVTESRNKECDEKANLRFLDDEELTLMLAEEMPNLLVLNEENVMTNLFIYGRPSGD